MSRGLRAGVAWVRRFPFRAACAVATLGLLGVTVPLHHTIARLEQENQHRAREGEAVFARVVSAATLRQELGHARNASHRIEENLVVPANLAENLWYFYKLEEQHQVRLPELHQLSSGAGATTADFRAVPYSLRAAGSYRQLIAFVQALETGPRLVRITSFDWARTSPADDLHTLDLNLEMLGKK